MASSKKVLKLTAAVYNQPVDDQGNTVRVERGEEFEPRSQAEYDRLISLDAAIDPEREHELEQQRVEEELERLDQERKHLDERRKQLQDEAKASSPQSQSKR